MIDVNADIQLLSQELRGRVDLRLEQLIESAGSNDNLTAAIRYVLLAPGKRLRPLICLISAQCLGGETDAAIDPACAVEMVHTASLILDDLPCMDDAEMRRGQLACHRRFGEATTILAALELLSLGYKVMSEAAGLDDSRRNRLVQVLATAVGINGLIGGQERDLAAEKHGDVDAADTHQVMRIHELKTSALFIAAAESGGLVAGLDGDQLLPIRDFAGRIGMAYQTMDDLLDAHGSAAEAGKDVHKDGDKPTLVGVLGSEGASDYANKMIAGALAALQPLGTDMQPLENLVQNVIGKSVAGRRTIN
jgi:geranylgeranyl diphosphate synthase type II